MKALHGPGYIEVVKAFLHVVVGAGFPHLFVNALNSLLQHTDDDVLAIYNRVSAKDSLDGLWNAEQDENKRVRVIERANHGHWKVGGLYSAYNIALDLARGSYEYLSLMQGDMQVVRWPKDAYESVQLAFENPHNPVFCVSTSLRTFGFSSSTDPSLDASSGGFGFRLNANRSVSDVGIFRMDIVEAEKFRFDEAEGVLSARMLAKGFQMAELERPWLAFVPWPPTVRGGRLLGVDPAQKFGFPVLIKNSDSFASTILETTDIWTESEIVPASCRTLFPFWPTDMQSSKWFHRRLNKCREIGIGFFTTIDSKGNLGSFFWAPWGSRHPSFPWLIARIVAAIISITAARIRQSWSSLLFRARSRI